MIRTYPYLGRPPFRCIAPLVTKERKKISSGGASSWQSWRQKFITDEEHAPFMKWILRNTHYEVEGPGDLSVVLHTVQGEVEPHADQQDRSCYLIPVHFGRLTRFCVESPRTLEVSRKGFRKGRLFRFNDHNTHWLESDETCINQMISVARN